MAVEGALTVRVVSPERVMFEGEVASLVAPAWDGKIGILPNHAPMLALLGGGELVLDLPGGGSETFHVAGGVLKVVRNDVTVLTEYVGHEPPERMPETVAPPEAFEEYHASRGNPLV